ncbi:peptidylprolyl isomerase [Parvularcula sp. LCG005]|uniref:peptidylprolyl isomerase n=1 Tax=Parvularcula sp. LCG005 TaxID=3078805 RepID=UPI00397D7567
MAQEEDVPAVTYARIQTSMGNIDIALFREEAPVTTANFLQYATDGHYDRTIFHRVVTDTLIQGGGYSARLYERATRDPIVSEAANGLKNTRGTLAMARYEEPDSATSQFFINIKDNPFLDRSGDTYKKDAGYAVFGEVVGGMDVVDAIGSVATGAKDGAIYLAAEVPVEPIIIKRVDPIDEDEVQRD